MVVVNTDKIGLCRSNYLILFFIFLACCTNQKQTSSAEVTILWKDGHAMAIAIPRSYVEKINQDSIAQLVSVRLVSPAETAAILGEITFNTNGIEFVPVIPFTPGLRYEVVVKNDRVAEIEIPEPDPAEGPALLGVFPSQDTLPLNMLKVYLQFSKPMAEGQSQKYIVMLKNNRDTARAVFLDLQPELWNSDQTMLTLWLDPGRIKRDLQPNKLLGNPLQEGEEYTLLISDQWKDLYGAALQSGYSKHFLVTSRDSLSPVPGSWMLNTPVRGTVNALEVNFKEPLDYSLLNAAFQVRHAKGRSIKGSTRTRDEERIWQFTPAEPWMKGGYVLQIETRLEDLAGNNLNRPFDLDLKSQNANLFSGKMVEIPFIVK